MPVSWLPSLNASLNFIAASLLIFGFINIKRRNINAHKKFMLSALFVSTAFLVSYVIYHYSAGSTPYQHDGWSRIVYLSILVPHIILAALMGPFILVLLWRALTESFEKHKRLARVVLPAWLYVSISGVIVYIMLYHL